MNIKRLHSDAIVPTYADEGSSGFDLYSLKEYIVYPGETKVIETGWAIEVPRDLEVQIRPRSGLSIKTGLRVVNSPGTIDASFRGQVCVIIQNIHTTTFTTEDGKYFVPKAIKINKGDRIAQGVLCPIRKATFEEVKELSETTRGSGGFGHSGS